MTTTLSTETGETETAQTPSVRDLPALYRFLTSLIPEPEQFFHGLVQIQEGPLEVTAARRHTGHPAIRLTQLPHPMDRECTGAAGGPGEEPNTRHRTPGPLHLSVATKSGSVPDMEETLEREFEAAMLEAAKQMLQGEAQAGLITREDARLWNEPDKEGTLLAAAKCVFYASTDTGTIADHVDYLYTELKEAISDMLCRQVLDMLGTTCPVTRTGNQGEETAEDVQIPQIGITTRQYNKATLLMACSPECNAANSGAIPWVLAQPDVGVPPSHQGQFLGAERATAMAQGMTARGWTAMTRMSPDITRMVINQCSGLAEAAGIINWLAGLAQALDRTGLGEILNRQDVRARLSEPGDTLADRNIRRAAALAVSRTAANTSGASARTERDRRHDIADSLTYAQAMAVDGSAVTATSYGGLTKAVRRWHTKLNRDKIREQWQHLVNANGGTVRSWEPVLRYFEHQGVTATELTSEDMLLEEALELDHCVHLYGARSEGGSVRIFALRAPGGSRATAAITLSNGAWKVEQTRTRANHQAPEEMQACARQLARVCNREEPLPPEDSGGTW